MRAVALGLTALATLAAPGARASEIELDGVRFDRLFGDDVPDGGVPRAVLRSSTLLVVLPEEGSVRKLRLRFAAKDGAVLRPGVYLDAESSRTFTIQSLRRGSVGVTTHLSATFAIFGPGGAQVSGGRLDFTADTGSSFEIDVVPGVPGSVRAGSLEIELVQGSVVFQLGPLPELSPEEARELAQGPPEDRTMPSSPAPSQPPARRRDSFLFARPDGAPARPQVEPRAEASTLSPSRDDRQRFEPEAAAREPVVTPVWIDVVSRDSPDVAKGTEVVSVRTPERVERAGRVIAARPTHARVSREIPPVASARAKPTWLDALTAALRVWARWMLELWP